MLKHVNITVRGKVQGVYFRKYTFEKAIELDLKGYVTNRPDGAVYIEAEGEADKLNELIEWCNTGSPDARVELVNVTEALYKAFQDFYIKR